MSQQTMTPLDANPAARSALPGWRASRARNGPRLLVVALAHAVALVLLWRSAVSAAPPLVVPVSLLLLTPPAKTVASPEPVPRRSPASKRQPEPSPLLLPSTEQPVQSALATPVAKSEPESPAPPPGAAPIARLESPVPVLVQLPSSTADYLSNPVPSYPPASRRLLEQGRVLLRVLVDAQGTPQKVEIKVSSGFNRLDEVAVRTVEQWKFVPGTRDGVAVPMWVEVPLDFRLT